MEFELQHQILDGIYPVYHIVHGQEETLESIVPDAFPDIARIVSASGQVCLNEKESGEGSVRLTGTIHVSVLYIPENEECVRALSVPIPFQCVRDSPKIHAGMPVQTVLSTAFSDARMINPRKLLVRCSIVCGVTVYEKRSESLACDVACAQDTCVEKKLTRQDCCVITALIEKPFVFSDILRQSASKPPIEDLLFWRGLPETVEGKVIGSKVVCKGVLQFAVLYRSGSRVVRADFELPFSQVAELPEDLPDGMAELLLTVKHIGCTLRDGELELSVELLLQGAVWIRKELTVMSDAYCVTSALDAEYEMLSLYSAWEQAGRRETARQFCPSGIPAKEVVDCCVTVMNYTVASQECKAELNAEILYLSEDDALCGVNYTIPVSCELPGEGEHRCYCRPVGAASAVPVTGGLEVRTEIEFSWSVTNATSISYVSNLKDIADSGEAAMRPSVIIRMTGGQESLWDIAKGCHSTVKDICEANGLQSEQIPVGKMLLIPVRRN